MTWNRRIPRAEPLRALRRPASRTGQVPASRLALPGNRAIRGAIARSGTRVVQRAVVAADIGNRTVPRLQVAAWLNRHNQERNTVYTNVLNFTSGLGNHHPGGNPWTVQIHYDMAGATHGGVPTPHAQVLDSRRTHGGALQNYGGLRPTIPLDRAATNDVIGGAPLQGAQAGPSGLANNARIANVDSVEDDIQTRIDGIEDQLAAPQQPAADDDYDLGNLF